MQAQMKFREMLVGDTFDFIGGEYPSFFERCIKVSKRCYVGTTKGLNYHVGSINATVYHIEGRTDPVIKRAVTAHQSAA